MQTQDDSFTIAVEINKGLEPLTLMIIPFEGLKINPENHLKLKIIRDNIQLAILYADHEECWQQLEGDFEREDINSIGAAIECHYECR